MKQKFYRGEIISRFISEETQKLFDKLYEENKVVSLGQNAANHNSKDRLLSKSLKIFS